MYQESSSRLSEYFTSRIRDIQTSSESSTCKGLVPFCNCTGSITGAVGPGHCHFGKARMARVGVMKLKVPPWRIGNLKVSTAWIRPDSIHSKSDYTSFLKNILV